MNKQHDHCRVFAHPETFVISSCIEGIYHTILENKEPHAQHNLPKPSSSCLNMCNLLLPPNFPAVFTLISNASFVEQPISPILKIFDSPVSMNIITC